MKKTAQKIPAEGAAVPEEIQRLTSDYRHAMDEWTKATGQNRELSRQIVEKSHDLTALQSEHEHAMDEWAKAAELCRELSAQAAQKDQALAALQSERQQAVNERSQLFEQNRALQADVARREEAHQQTAQELTARAERLQARADELELSCRTLEAQRDSSMAELSRVTALYQSTLQQLQQTDAAYQALRQRRRWRSSAPVQGAKRLVLAAMRKMKRLIAVVVRKAKRPVVAAARKVKRVLPAPVRRVLGKGYRTGKSVVRRLKALRPVAPADTTQTLGIIWPPQGQPPCQTKPAALPEDCKRLGIYTFYDADGVVDGYVTYFLEQYAALMDRLIIVCNGTLNPEGQKALSRFTKEIIVRENTGFDAWGIRTGLLHAGWDNLHDYDEILIANNTLMGPVLPLRGMLDEMASREVDFWGVSSHAVIDYDPFGCNPYGLIPEHVQSFFYGVRRTLFTSPAFQTFWNDLPVLDHYNKAVGLYETVMTKYLSDLGFRWDCYLDRAVYYDMTDDPLTAMPTESIRDWRCPLVKRRAFFQDYDYLTSFTGQQSASLLMQYLQEETDYPVDLIWANLIRTCHMSDLTTNLHLSQILDADNYFGKPIKSVLAKRRAALFMHIYNTSMAEELAGYAAHLPPEADIYISTTSEDRRDAILSAFKGLPHRLEVRVCPNRGRDVSALLASFKDVVMQYAYICVTHDKKTSYLKPETVGEGFAYMGYHNILASREFVCNVIQAFEENARLGLLYAPAPNHADFATQIGLEWGPNFEPTAELARTLGLRVPMDEAHPPCAPFGSSFWARTDALAPLFAKDWTYDDFPKEPFNAVDGSLLHAIERIYPYCAQQAGFYSALLMTTDYSAVELGNLQFYAQRFTHVCFDHGIENRYITVRDQLDAWLS